MPIIINDYRLAGKHQFICSLRDVISHKQSINLITMSSSNYVEKKNMWHHIINGVI